MNLFDCSFAISLFGGGLCGAAAAAGLGWGVISLGVLGGSLCGVATYFCMILAAVGIAKLMGFGPDKDDGPLQELAAAFLLFAPVACWLLAPLSSFLIVAYFVGAQP